MWVLVVFLGAGLAWSVWIISVKAAIVMRSITSRLQRRLSMRKDWKLVTGAELANDLKRALAKVNDAKTIPFELAAVILLTCSSLLMLHANWLPSDVLAMIYVSSAAFLLNYLARWTAGKNLRMALALMIVEVIWLFWGTIAYGAADASLGMRSSLSWIALIPLLVVLIQFGMVYGGPLSEQDLRSRSYSVRAILAWVTVGVYVLLLAALTSPKELMNNIPRSGGFLEIVTGLVAIGYEQLGHPGVHGTASAQIIILNIVWGGVTGRIVAGWALYEQRMREERRC